jgi:hypothetical protein
MKNAQKAYDEIVDMFAMSTTSVDVLASRPSRQSQQRVRYLLRRLKSDELTKAEAVELECFSELEHLMQFVKARASYILRRVDTSSKFPFL